MVSGVLGYSRAVGVTIESADLLVSKYSYITSPEYESLIHSLDLCSRNNFDTYLFNGSLEVSSKHWPWQRRYQ